MLRALLSLFPRNVRQRWTGVARTRRFNLGKLQAFSGVTSYGRGMSPLVPYKIIEQGISGAGSDTSAQKHSHDHIMQKISCIGACITHPAPWQINLLTGISLLIQHRTIMRFIRGGYLLLMASHMQGGNGMKDTFQWPRESQG